MSAAIISSDIDDIIGQPPVCDNKGVTFSPITGELIPDLNEAQRFLQLLDPNAEAFIFQTFDDNKTRKDGRMARVLAGSLSDHADTLTRLNCQGAGIFVTVNRSKTSSRKKSDIESYRAIFREADDPDLPELPIEPSIVISTSPGKRHEYLLLDQTTDGDTWDNTMAGMVQTYGSDPNARDRARVLRLPGFYHQKDPDTPHMVSVIHDGGKRYSLTDLASIIRRPARRQEAPPRKTSGLSPYVSKALDLECERVRQATEGDRNATLNKAGFALGQLIAGGDLDEEMVIDELTAAAQQAGLAAGEIAATTRSGLESGKQSPRQAPNRHTHYTAADLQGKPQGGNAPQSIKPSPYARFYFRTAAELTSAIAPTEWLITDILEAGALGTLVGDTGTYKTFLAVSLGLSIATGTPWYGRSVKKGLVVFIIGEGSNGFAKRLMAWSLSAGVKLDHAALIVSSAPAQILDDDFVKHVRDCIAMEKDRFGEPALIVIDTLARNFGAGDENSAEDMSNFIGNLDEYLGNKCTRLIVHHTGLSDKGRGRGSSALKAAVDTELFVEKTDEGLSLACNKMKDAPPFHPVHFKPVTVDIETTDPNKPETSFSLVELARTLTKEPAKLSPQMRMALDLLKVMSSQRRKKDLLNRCLSCVQDWMTLCIEESVYTRTSFYTAIKTMEEKGVIGITDCYVWLS